MTEELLCITKDGKAKHYESSSACTRPSTCLSHLIMGRVSSVWAKCHWRKEFASPWADISNVLWHWWSVVPVEDLLCGVEKVIGTMPEETGEEVWQETRHDAKRFPPANPRTTDCCGEDSPSGCDRQWCIQCNSCWQGMWWYWILQVVVEDQGCRKLKKDCSESVDSWPLFSRNSYFVRKFANNFDQRLSRSKDCMEDPQAGGSREHCCEHLKGPNLSNGQTCGGLTGLSYCQLSTPF